MSKATFDVFFKIVTHSTNTVIFVKGDLFFIILYVPQCGKTRNSLSLKKIHQINYVVLSLVKQLLSQNLCEKRVRENFYNFPTLEYSAVWKSTMKHDHAPKIS